MIYFKGITDLEQAKLRYRKLAKQLHPDAGGTAVEFQKMQDEYEALLMHLQQKCDAVINVSKSSSENELLSQLEKLANVLIKKQVPQNYLRKKIQNSEPSLKRGLFSEIVDLLDSIK